MYCELTSNDKRKKGTPGSVLVRQERRDATESRVVWRMRKDFRQYPPSTAARSELCSEGREQGAGALRKAKKVLTMESVWRVSTSGGGREVDGDA